MMIQFKKAGYAAALCGTLLASFSGRAEAQTEPGFAINQYEPSERGSEWFFSDSLDFRGHLRPFAGAVFDYAHKPLVIVNPDDSESALVQNQFFAHLGGSVVLWERLRLGASLPVALYQSGTPAVINGQSYVPPDEAALGDLRFGADMRLLGSYRDVFSLAAGMQVWLPTGSREQYTSDGTVRFGGHLLAAGEVGLFAYAARFGVNYRNLEGNFGGSPLGSDMPFSVAAGVRVLDGKLLLGPELSGKTVLADGAAFEASTTSLELALGGHWTLGEFRLGAAMGPGLNSGVGTPMFRSLLSAEYIGPVATDADGDGVPDAKDRCPQQKGVSTGSANELGCPLDSDHDSISDEIDACPREFGVSQAEPAKNGCPLPPDADNDGVPDELDHCPDVAAPTADGCPLPPADADNDGIPDASDACPNQAGAESSSPEKNGCPLPPDADSDGIPDANDACPNLAGSPSEEEGKNGCPKAQVEGDQVSLSESLKFTSGSAELAPESDAVLADIARAIQGLPAGNVVRVEGHTDTTGSRAMNLKLSQARAQTVVTWLIEKGGIPSERVSAVGIGDAQPLVSNGTAEGRATNRRVEFHIVTP